MKRYVAFAVLGVALIVAGWRWSRRAGSTAAEQELASASPQGEHGGPGEISSWDVGSRRAYRFDYAAAVDYQMKGDGNDKNKAGKLTAFMDGTLSATVLEKTDDGKRTVEMTVQVGQLDARGIKLSMPPDALKKEIGRPFLVTYDREGAAVGITFPTAVARQANTLIRDLVSLLQVTVRRGPTWTAIEAEPGGQCLVSLRRLDDGRIAKQKQRFLTVERAGKLVKPEETVGVPAFEQSTATYRIDGSGRVLDAQTNHVSVAKIELVEGQVRTDIRASFTHIESGRQPVAARGGGPRPPSRPLTEMPGDNTVEPSTGAAKLPPVKELLATMKRAEQASDWPALHEAQSQLSAAIERDPAELPKLLKGDLTQPTLSAIGAAGSPEAQAALLKVVGDPVRALEQRKNAVEAFHEVRDASDHNIGKLLEVADKDPELRDSALLAAGGLINRKRESDGTSAAAWTGDLVGRYEKATTDAERIQMLDAIGNSGSADGLDTIQAALSSPSLEVRAAAATNLRLMPAPRADQLLVGLLGTGVEPAVRQAALFAVGFRQPGPIFPAVETLLRTEPAAELRMTALNVVVTFLQRDGATAVVPLIRWLAENDPDESVRQQARGALGS